jgi:ATP-dependent protease HslVU (ClpYQ) peptidase subunit
MSTILYDKNIIAYESRTCLHEYILTDKANKKVVKKKGIFFPVGCHDDMKNLIDCYCNDKLDIIKGNNAISFIVENKKVYSIFYDPEREIIRKIVCSQDYPHAIGSGKEFALGAFEMGADITKAMEIAIAKDLYSGGKINYFKI